jgi:large subunit ribosomal protein L17
MLRNMACGLFEHGQIVTTVPKAKCLQPFIEKIVTLAKRGDLAARRRVIQLLGGDRLGFDWLYLPRDASEKEKAHVDGLRELTTGFFDLPDSSEVERNRYGELRRAPKVVKHIFSRVAPRFQDRQGGYTRIIKLAKVRIGDASPLCVLQFVGNSANEGPEIGGRTSVRRKKADRRTAFAAKLRKEKDAAAAPAAPEAPAGDAPQA